MQDFEPDPSGPFTRRVPTCADAGASDQSVDWWVDGDTQEKTYTLILAAARGGTITGLTAVLASGTVDLAVAINGTPVTGLEAVSVSAVESETLATALNTFEAGDTVTLAASNLASPVDLAFTLAIED